MTADKGGLRMALRALDSPLAGHGQTLPDSDEFTLPLKACHLVAQCGQNSGEARCQPVPQAPAVSFEVPATPRLSEV